jgi:hypothetical protein
MYVKIGNYPNTHMRSTVHTDYMDKKYGYLWEENQTKFEHWLEKLENFIQGFYNITINKLIRNRDRKVKVRIDPSDTWNMDETLAHIIVPMLKQIKESKHSSPYVDDEDVPDHLRSTETHEKENGYDFDKCHVERWEWILNEMIFAFESKTYDWEEQFYSGEIDTNWIKQENGFYQMVNGPNDTFKVDEKSRKLYYKRMGNGFRLFGKYYESLWD